MKESLKESLHVVCPHCDATNRIPAARLGQRPKCGSCHNPLFTGHPAELSAERFAKHIDRGDLPVVVDFWAPWCGPCKMMAPAFEQAARELEPQVRFAKINTDEEQALGARIGIRSIPTMALFTGGQEVARQAGAVGAADIVRWVKSRL